MSECEIIVKMDKHIKIKGGTYKQDLIRCKDCKYWDNTKKWTVCTRWSADPYEQANTEKNDFCSYGERTDE